MYEAKWSLLMQRNHLLVDGYIFKNKNMALNTFKGENFY